MHMDDYDQVQVDFNSSPTYSVSVDSLKQFTNCLDGLLRDPHGNVIKLDPKDYQHQVCHDPYLYAPVCRKKPHFYVVKNGRMIEVSLQSPLWTEDFA